MDLGIAGRKAIVCASSRGLGRACAMRLAEAGCEVVVNGLDPADHAFAQGDAFDLLVTCSCSARVSADQFFEAVKEAAFKTRVELALVAETRQPCDHPISLQFKEGRYLKAMVLRRLS